MAQENNLTFIPPQPLNTAVLFLVFNRLDTTKQVFEAIRQAKPPRLYIAADGARETREGEAKRVGEVREFILSNIDWKCEIKTLFREENLGCKYAVSGAIDWFFANEEMGIILEDDCLPSQSFFWFCEELLERYKDDMRVWHIGGSNFQNGIKRGDADYYFSKYNHVWGWASWANRWKMYDIEVKDLNLFIKEDLISTVFINKKWQQKWIRFFNEVKNNKIDTWDFQWQYSIWINSGLGILPNINLISNIGFNREATHTSDSNSAMSNRDNFEITICQHPKNIYLNTIADDYEYKQYYCIGILKRIKNKIFKIKKGIDIARNI